MVLSCLVKHILRPGAKYVNQAGRQRWMSMRIAKYSFAERVGAMPKGEATQQIEKLRKEWTASQKELRAAANGLLELETELDESTSRFNTLMDAIDSGKDVKTVARLSDYLIESLHAAVKLFERIS